MGIPTWRNDTRRLGFGLMRLPKDEYGIDLAKFAMLADTFIAHGFSYFDTAYVYDGSEEAFREVVAKRHPREAFTIADKMAGWLLNETFTAEMMFQKSLERCGVSYFDYYLLHSMQPSRYTVYDKNGCWDFCRRMKAKGKIRNFGFSFHGGPQLLDQILSEHPEVDFVQLQINYADWNSNAIFSRENYEVAVKHGKDITVMEPVKSGILARLKPNEDAEFKKLSSDSSASYALRFAASLPNVRMVLSGMNEEFQIADNMKTFTEYRLLTPEEEQVIAKVRDMILSTPTIPCTDCRYCCKGCPRGINIPEVFKAYNMYLTFGEHTRPRLFYDGLVLTGSGKASDCIACGQCEAACPQHIKIIEELKTCSEYFDKKEIITGGYYG